MLRERGLKPIARFRPGGFVVKGEVEPVIRTLDRRHRRLRRCLRLHRLLDRSIGPVGRVEPWVSLTHPPSQSIVVQPIPSGRQVVEGGPGRSVLAVADEEFDELGSARRVIGDPGLPASDPGEGGSRVAEVLLGAVQAHHALGHHPARRRLRGQGFAPCRASLGAPVMGEDPERIGTDVGRGGAKRLFDRGSDVLGRGGLPQRLQGTAGPFVTLARKPAQGDRRLFRDGRRKTTDKIDRRTAHEERAIEERDQQLFGQDDRQARQGCEPDAGAGRTQEVVDGDLVVRFRARPSIQLHGGADKPVLAAWRVERDGAGGGAVPERLTGSSHEALKTDLEEALAAKPRDPRSGRSTLLFHEGRQFLVSRVVDDVRRLEPIYRNVRALEGTQDRDDRPHSIVDRHGHVEADAPVGLLDDLECPGDVTTLANDIDRRGAICGVGQPEAVTMRGRLVDRVEARSSAGISRPAIVRRGAPPEPQPTAAAAPGASAPASFASTTP